MTGLSRSKQDYLKALFTLGPEGETATTSELARVLGVSSPSVTNMLARLASERLVTHTPRVGAQLSAEGRRQAIGLVRRHRILECFLVEVLGLDSSEVHDDAEVLEHHVSDRVLDAMDRLLGHPTEDPHGHPIPDARGRLPRRALAPLSAAGAGASVVVRETRDRDRGRLSRWKQLGLVPGAKVRVLEVRPSEGVHELDVDGRRLVTGTEALEGVRVEAEREPAPRGPKRRAGPQV